MFNEWTGIGRWTEDPSAALRYTTSGKAVMNCDLAVNEGFGDKRTIEYVHVVVWEKTAEAVANHSGKGRLVLVVGRLATRKYETQDGQKRERAEVIASTVRFLDKAPDAGAAAGGGPKPGGAGSEPRFDDESDVPF